MLVSLYEYVVHDLIHDTLISNKSNRVLNFALTEQKNVGLCWIVLVCCSEALFSCKFDYFILFLFYYFILFLYSQSSIVGTFVTEHVLGFELTTDRLPVIRSIYPLRHTAPYLFIQVYPNTVFDALDCLLKYILWLQVKS